MINVLLIGCGYHARRIYVPCLSKRKGIHLSAIVDLHSQEQVIANYLSTQNISDVVVHYTQEYSISDNLTEIEIVNLDNLISRHSITAVVISTEPLAHFKYAKWALSKGLHILMDKPISTELGISTDEEKAKKIYSDYLFLKGLYNSKRTEKNLVFTLLAQRRHHAGFKKTRELIVEISQKTNCPVTSVEAFHSDGQWRFPREVVEQHYHPYNQGYGKMSHSGYHSLDTSVWFAQSSVADPLKAYDTFQVYSQFVRPVDFFQQINSSDYKRLFPKISEDSLVTADEMMSILKTEDGKNVTGEIDAHTIISLLHDERVMTNIGLHSIHNGFSQRNWVSSVGRDLYKGNGRVRHESYIIEQGPFQCIIVNSFQSHEILKGNIDPYSMGGEYHYDIHVFRNSTLFPEFKSYEFMTMKDLNSVEDLGYSRGHQENARRDCIEEFFQSIETNASPASQQSNFLEHELSTQLLGAIYQSASIPLDKKTIQGKIHNL